MLAVIGVAVLVVAVVALRDPKNPSSQSAGSTTRTVTSGSASPSGSASSSRTAPSTSTSSTAANTPTVTQLKSEFPLVVLNNTTTQGLASEAAQRFEQGGWKVTSYGNLDNTILSTCAYFDPSVKYAKRAAEALQREYPTIQRVEPKFTGLVSGPVVVVLTPDYSNS